LRKATFPLAIWGSGSQLKSHAQETIRKIGTPFLGAVLPHFMADAPLGTLTPPLTIKKKIKT
jgi:hypothetical protein